MVRQLEAARRGVGQGARVAYFGVQSGLAQVKALEAAESDLLNRRIVTIPAKDWARFEAWAGAPAREVPALRKLSKTRPVWQK